MTRFTTENTEGFSASDLATINTVFDDVMGNEEASSDFSEFSDDTIREIEKSLADTITNEWQPGMNAADLKSALRRHRFAA